MLYETQGIIIKKTNLGEFDRLLTVYTKDFGKILVRAKAVRKNQAKLKGHLELFLHSHLIFAQGKNLDIVTNAEIIEDFPYLHQRLPCLAAAYYLAELVDKLIAGPEKDENIWPLLLLGFENLNRPGVEIKLLISNFENKLLEFLGYGRNQKNIPSFIESLLGDKLGSRNFLQEALCLLK